MPRDGLQHDNSKRNKNINALLFHGSSMTERKMGFATEKLI